MNSSQRISGLAKRKVAKTMALDHVEYIWLTSFNIYCPTERFKFLYPVTTEMPQYGVPAIENKSYSGSCSAAHVSHFVLIIFHYRDTEV